MENKKRERERERESESARARERENRKDRATLPGGVVDVGGVEGES